MALWRIRATVDDRPGFLSVLTASLALRAVNILAVQVHTTEAGAVDDFLVDAPDSLTEEDLLAAVERGRGRDAWATRAHAQVLVDPPTRALALAGRVARDPEELGEALAALLDGAVLWRPAGVRPGVDGAIMRLVDPNGGSFEVTRPAPAFTPAEYARAQAMIDLGANLVRQAAARVHALLPDGAEVVIRPAGPDDHAALLAMHTRCSADSRRRRYGDPSAAVETRVDRLMDGSRSAALVAEAVAAPDEGSIVGVASLLAEDTLAEGGLLVEDDWQRRGVGTALLRRLARVAGASGYAALVLPVPVTNDAMLRTLRRLGLPHHSERDDDLVTVTVPLARPKPLARQA